MIVSNKKTPNPKFQAPNKFQLPNDQKVESWNLEIGDCLMIGLSARRPVLRDDGRCLEIGNLRFYLDKEVLHGA